MKEANQLTSKVVMVRPEYFGFNHETGVDNVFQNQPSMTDKVTRKEALIEFDLMVDELDTWGVGVVELPSPMGPKGEITPDAIFPNNWFSTHPGRLVLYPMKAANRRLERQPQTLRRALSAVGVRYPATLDLTEDELNGDILEGTGSLVLDRVNGIAYALESARTTKKEMLYWSELMEYTPFFFHAVDMGGRPVYHTNVVMSVGDGFAVVCLEAVRDAAERGELRRSLERNGKMVVQISMEQMYNYCGNILQVNDVGGEPLVVMSERAFAAFSRSQIEVIERHGLIVPVGIETIERVGGGSARCMMAEVF